MNWPVQGQDMFRLQDMSICMSNCIIKDDKIKAMFSSADSK